MDDAEEAMSARTEFNSSTHGFFSIIDLSVSLDFILSPGRKWDKGLPQLDHGDENTMVSLISMH